MRRTLIIVLTALLLIGTLFVSCSDEASDVSSSTDKTFSIVIDENTSKGITATTASASAEDYYWYYKASKADSSAFRTGQTVASTTDGNNNIICGAGGWKPVKNGEKGLTGANLGYFSTGDWKFCFRAYPEVVSSWDTTDLNQALDDSTTPANISFAYFQDNLAVEVSTDTIASDNKVYITVSLETSDNAPDAILNIADLNWLYTNDSTADAAATIAALNGQSACMKVFYANAPTGTDTASDITSWNSLAINGNDASVATANSVTSATFSSFKKYDGTNASDGNITLTSSVAGTAYALKFEVYVNNELVGTSYVESVTAAKGGVISVSRTSSDSAAVSDNEHQYQVVVDSIDITATVSGTSSSASIAAATVPEVVEPTATNTATNASTPSVKTTISSTVVATTTDTEKKTTVTIPAAALDSTTVSKTYETSNGSITTVTTSSTNDLAMEVSTSEIDEPTFTVTEGNSSVAQIDLTMTKVTTETTVVTTNNVSTTTGSTQTAGTVTTFNDKYVTVSTYIATGLTNVQVGYNGDAEQPIFNASGTPDTDTASADATNSNTGTGYNPETGLLVFKTKHFSSFIVAGKVAEAKIGSTYYSTLVEAVSAAQDGDTVTQLQNIDYTEDYARGSFGQGFDLTGKTLDLNEMSITSKNGGIYFYGTHATIKNGTFYAAPNTTGEYYDSYSLFIGDWKDADTQEIRNSFIIDGVTCYGGINPYDNEGVDATIKNSTVYSTRYYTVCSQGTGSIITIESGNFSRKNSEGGLVTPIDGIDLFYVADNSYDGYDNSLFVVGGTYDADPSDYVPAGYSVVYNDNTQTYTVEEGLYNFAALKKFVEDGTTTDAVVYSDFDITGTVNFDREVNINLNGHILSNTTTGSRPFNLLAQADVTIDGTTDGSSIIIPSTNTASYGLFFLKEDSYSKNGTIEYGPSLILNGGTYSGPTDRGALIKAKGTVISNIEMHSVIADTLGGGIISAEEGLQLSGTDENEVKHRLSYNNTTIDNCTINQGSALVGAVNSNLSIGCLTLQSGTISNSTITTLHGEGIAVYAGNVTVSNCNVTVSNENPTAGWLGTALAAANDGDIIINGGTYTGSNYGAYIYTSNGHMYFQNNPTVSGTTALMVGQLDVGTYSNISPSSGYALQNIDVESGTYNGNITVETPSGSNLQGTMNITGGTFNVNPSDYVADGYSATQNGSTWTVSANQ